VSERKIEMKMKWLILAVIVSSLVLLGACKILPTPPEPPPVTPTPTPPTPEPPEGVLYSDDFSDDTSGWDTFEDEDGWASYTDGWLHVTNYTPAELATFSMAHQYFEDFILEVETKLVDGTDDNYHQIAIRANDERGDGYNFGVSADGYYQIGIEIAGSSEQVTDPISSSHILQGWDVINLIRIECVGSTLRLFVNGHLLKEFTDSRLQGGDIGLGSSSLAGTFSEVAFDNIVVTAP